MPANHADTEVHVCSICERECDCALGPFECPCPCLDYYFDEDNDDET